MSSEQSEGEAEDKFSDENDESRSEAYEELELSNNFNTNAELNNNSVGRLGSNNTGQLSNIVISNREISEMSNINQLQEQLIDDNVSESELVMHSIDDMILSMGSLINEEKTKIKADKANLIRAKQQFKDHHKRQLIKHEQEVEKWKSSLDIVNGINCQLTDLFDLDIGGTEKITTTRATLRKYPNSALGAMFSGKHKIPMHNGRVFIDREGKAFLYMIQFLRNGRIPSFNNDIERQNFFEEIDFWQIPFEDPDSLLKSRFVFDPNWCAETLSIENNGKSIKKTISSHGIIFCKPEMDEENSYIEFKVGIHIPCKGKSHLFIGLVDRSKYKYDDLLSTFWKDSPSSFYWDAWNTKLIKTDEHGTQVATHSSYGCPCEDFDTKFAIKYNIKAKTIEFYKNNANLGVAFRNVPPGLTPSLDIWFESGTVDILSNRTIDDKIYL